MIRLFREVGLTLNPTFVTFTPWTTPEGYLDLLGLLAELGMVDNVPPVQWAIRLLVPPGSRLLVLPALAGLLDEFDERALFYPWRHPDARVDQLYGEVLETVKQGHRDRASRREVFGRVWKVAAAANPDVTPPPSVLAAVADLERGSDAGQPSPSMSEPWYCCAEPTEEQLAPTV